MSTHAWLILLVPAAVCIAGVSMFVTPSPRIVSAPTEAPATPPTVAPITPSVPTIGPRPTVSSAPPADPTILANSVVVRLLDHLRQRGISVGNPHESRAAFLYPVEGVAYEFDRGHLHIHPFPSPEAAEQRARQIPPEITRSLIDWVAPPHFYRCGSAIALYLGNNDQVIRALTDVCGAAFATEEGSLGASPTVVPSADIREQVVKSLERPGRFTQVRTTIHQLGDRKDVEYVTMTWLDLFGRRARAETVRLQGVSYITVLDQRRQLTYYPDTNQVYENEWVLPSDRIVKIPPAVNNGALIGMMPLTLALLADPWEFTGMGTWQGRSAALWKAKHAGPDGGSIFTTIYLDPDNHLPLAQDLFYAQREGEPVHLSESVEYDIEFVAAEALPQDAFDLEALRQLKSEFGGRLRQATGLGFSVLWLGREVQVANTYPRLTMESVRLRKQEDPDGAFAGFTYAFSDANSAPPLQGTVHVLVWPRSQWDSTIEVRAGSMAWWRNPAVKREPINVGSLRGDYAIGDLEPPAQTQPANPSVGYTPAPPRTYMEAIVWLPDSIVRVSTSPVLLPARRPSEPQESVTPTTVSSDLENLVDANPFNTLDGMKLVLQALLPLQ